MLRNRRAFTLIEATMSALLLSVILGMSAEFMLGRIKEARRTEIYTAVSNIAETCNTALGRAYEIEMDNAMQALIRENKKLGNFSPNISAKLKDEVVDLVRTHFKHSVYAPDISGESTATDTYNLSQYGARKLEGEEQNLSYEKIGTLANGLKVKIDFQKGNGQPNLEKSADNRWELIYENGQGKWTLDLYNTLLVVIDVASTDGNTIDTFQKLGQCIDEGAINPEQISILLITEGEFKDATNEPVSVTISRALHSPFSQNNISRLSEY